MTVTPLKFYQVGSFAVGNRLLTDEERSEQSNPDRINALTSGHRACQGCGEALGARYVVDAAMRATGNQLMAANATGCLEVFSTPYPETSWQLPWIHSLFGNAAAVGTGIAAALKVKAIKAGAEQGAEVLIGSREDAVVFDFDPSVAAGAEVLLNRRGHDIRIEAFGYADRTKHRDRVRAEFDAYVAPWNIDDEDDDTATTPSGPVEYIMEDDDE